MFKFETLLFMNETSKKIKLVSLIVFFLSCSLSVSSQNEITFEYNYDAAGNRITRCVIELKKYEVIDTLQYSGDISDNYNPMEQPQMGNSYDFNISDISISIFPNPVHGLLYVEIQGIKDATQVVSYDILDTGGKSINSGSLNDFINELDFSLLPPSIYFVRLKYGMGVREFKVIKEQ